jgi:peptidyl-prolyl cis-trans isomerase C
LRTRVQTDAGRRDLVSAIVDKRLLAQEARRRKLDADPEMRRQVEELEERLLIQALLAAEETASGAPSEAELREYHAAHQDELATPERIRVRRVLAAVPAAASQPERERAKERAERFAVRLRAGEPFEKVAAEGDGPERAHGGDLGLIARGEGKDPRLEKAAFALTQPGARTPVVPVADGFAVLELVERRPGRVPSFEEARGDAANRLASQRKRRVFDDLLARLRNEASVAIEVPAGPR